MQLVGEMWQDLGNDKQLWYNNWDYINKLCNQMGLKELANPECSEPKDDDTNPSSGSNPSLKSIDLATEEEPWIPLSKKANNEAELVCEKRVNMATRDVSGCAVHTLL